MFLKFNFWYISTLLALTLFKNFSRAIMSVKQGCELNLSGEQLLSEETSFPPSLRSRSLAELLLFASSSSTSSFSASSLHQVDGPLDSTSESDKSESDLEKRKKKRFESEDVDIIFFEAMEKLEDDLVKENLHKVAYLGCLRSESAAKVLPYGHLILRDSDDLKKKLLRTMFI